MHGATLVSDFSSVLSITLLTPSPTGQSPEVVPPLYGQPVAMYFVGPGNGANLFLRPLCTCFLFDVSVVSSEV